MCSNCSGDYENPAMTQPDALDELFAETECGHCGRKLESPSTPCPCWDECPECFHPVHKGVCEFERGDAPGDGEHCAVAFPPCGCKHKFDGNQENGGDPCEGNGQRLLTESPSTFQRDPLDALLEAAFEAQQAKMRVECAWHPKYFGTELVMREGNAPASHGICDECRGRVEA